MPNKASNIKQQKETTGNGQRKEEEPEWKSQSIVIVNSKARTIKPITSDILVQEQKLKLKRGGKEDNINSCLRKRALILMIQICVHYAIDLLEQEENVGYVVYGFITDVKEPQRKEKLKNTHRKHTTYVKKQGTKSITSTN